MVDINNSAGAIKPTVRHTTLCLMLEQDIKYMETLTAVLSGQKLAAPKRDENEPINSNVASSIGLMIYALLASARTVLYLSETTGEHTRDCYSIARSIFEASVNTCYIIAKGEAAATQAQEHSEAMSIKDLSRKSSIGDSLINFTYIDTSEITIPNEIKSVIRKFETNKGRKKPWTPLSVDQRILQVGNKFKKQPLTYLHLSRFIIYSPASEILHGTLYGCKRFLGYTDPVLHDKPIGDVDKNISRQHELVLTACVYSMAAVVDCFHQAYGYIELHNHMKMMLSKLKNDDIQKEDLLTPYVNGFTAVKT